MRLRTLLTCAALLLGGAASASAQAVSLQFNNGRVTLNAQNAPIRTILTEWARLGGTRIVNGDRIGGAPVTLELNDVTERQALDILLRSAAGYVITTKQQPGGLSNVGGVVILATSSAPRLQAPVTFGTATVQPTPAFNDQRNDQDERVGNASPVVPINLPNVVRVGQNPQQGQPEPAAQPGPPRPVTTLQTLPGTSRPGEITPVPQQPPTLPPNQR